MCRYHLFCWESCQLLQPINILSERCQKQALLMQEAYEIVGGSWLVAAGK